MRVGLWTHDGASCFVGPSRLPDGMGAQILTVSGVKAPPESRGRGLATALMQEVLQAADESRTVLMLHAEPFGDSPVDRDTLVSWYGRLGFVQIQPEPLLMARAPGTPMLFNARPAAAAAMGAAHG